MSTHKLKVMHLILDLERDGGQTAVRILSEHLAESGCVPIVCTFNDGPLRADLEELGIPVEVIGPRRYSILALPWFVAEMIRVRRKLVQLVRKYEIDVVQTHLLNLRNFLALTLRDDTHPRVVLWTIQNVEFLPKGKHWLLRPKRFVHRLLYRLTAGKVNGFIAVSDQVRESLIGQIGPIPNKIFTICNAVDVKRFERPGDKAALCAQLGIEAHSWLVATVGRLMEQKGHCYLIDAAARVVPSCPDTHFLFIGDGELKDALMAQTRRAGLSENIHFLGKREDVPDLLAAVDLFALPSLWEGLSVALLEAMAAGKPIVATAVSGTTQAMLHGETGLVVPPHDSQALADAIIQLLSAPAEAQAMGRAAKQHVTVNFGAQKQADEHLALYCRLLDEQG
jgi:glycosyltransferase involved in cell wall biosynthesis